MSCDGASAPAMAAGNIHHHVSGDSCVPKAEAPAMVHDPVDTAGAEHDRLSGMPDDVLLDILGRLVIAGDVHTVARTSVLSRRWRSLPWPQTTNVFLDVGKFFPSAEWIPARRSRFWKQHHATAGFTDALARFLAAPASERVIERLCLKFILTRRDYVRRIGDLVGAAAGAGTVKAVEIEIVTEMESIASDVVRTMLGYGDRFVHLVQDCPGVFRSLTKLTLKNLWFSDADELSNLVRRCSALKFLSLSSCGFRPDTSLIIDDDEAPPPRPPVLTIDAPRSPLEILLCDFCYIAGVKLVQAPALGALRYRALLPEDSSPISFGCAPSLKALFLGQRQDLDNLVKLSELLINGGQLETLFLSFNNGRIWVRPELPNKQLRAALGGLKSLCLRELSPGCNLSWATFLLEAAPFLETLEITIWNHICRAEWRNKHRESSNLIWQQPSLDFRHNHLKHLSFCRAFQVEKDLPFARLLMELAVNLQTVTMGVKSLGCQECTTALRTYPDLARSRLRFTEGSEYADAFVKGLKRGIPTSAKITILLSDLV
ncbi:hypothetical protein ACP70R_026022 [Stipagrostis hirtigluma subsp. patula]